VESFDTTGLDINFSLLKEDDLWFFRDLRNEQNRDRLIKIAEDGLEKG